ncbi:hypothetical protein PSP20601_05424 [Pandoraea sputorum]|nr:hypothetical protein PSP20601_05424 [Pandoraea sputorum]
MSGSSAAGFGSRTMYDPQSEAIRRVSQQEGRSDAVVVLRMGT